MTITATTYARSKKLREERGKVSAQIRGMADALSADNDARKAKGEGLRDFTAEEKVAWEKVNADHAAYTRQIEIAEAADKVQAADEEPIGDVRVARQDWKKGRSEGAAAGATEEQKALALQAWMRYEIADPTPAQEDAATAAGVSLRSRFYAFERRPGMKLNQIWHARHGQLDYRAAMGHSPTAGGTTVPEGFMDSLEIATLQYGGVRQVAEVITTTGGEPMPWPTVNDTSNKGRRVNESGQINDLDATWGAVVFNAYKYTSDFIKIPYELLEDSAFNLAAVVGNLLGIRLGRIQNDEFTTGTGSAQPSGIVTNATTGVTTASATAIAADELFGLYHSVDPTYRGPGSGWMFHDNTLLSLRKLKDGIGRYLWQDGMSPGEPDMLLDRPYAINQSMASSIAASAITILFGQLNKHKIRDVAGVRLKRLDERYADVDQVAFVALSRHDSNTVDAGTHPIKSLVQHA